MPSFSSDSFASLQVFKDVRQHGFTVRRDLESLTQCVDDPAEDELSSSPAAVSLQQFLEGDCFGTMCFVRHRLGQDIVDGMTSCGSVAKTPIIFNPHPQGPAITSLRTVLVPNLPSCRMPHDVL